ncbi:NADPH-dependent assimilatory sulfite reductase hemoprotein subunit [Parafilimonas sp.]|uniref:NADPH-dependent assimilatory sulfite reductase hemoprotein subunit n=1 Tax=Parafilimonas sp. TaxID=1969739 RepID=UPI0039E6B975
MAESIAEKVKKESKGLRGTLKESLQDEHTGQIRTNDQLLIKFHGMYMQDDRDRRDERAEKKLDRLYSYMIRLRLPGGLLSAKQWVALHEVTNAYTTGVIKITTRQTVQLHGILKHNIKPTIKDFDTVKLDSIAACGDVNRNVVASAHPRFSAVYEEIFSYAGKLSGLLLPKTHAYYEIWLDKEKISPELEKDELYQDRYFPRKFKIAIAIPPYNDVDVFTNDIGLIAIVEKGRLVGFNVSAGGGMGATHGNAETYPRLASMLGFVKKEDLLKAAYEIATTQRDFGNRSDRKFARLKYTIDRMGVDVFKKEVETRSGIAFKPEKKYELTIRHDEFGWHQNHEGLWYYTAFVETGRVLDNDKVQFKKAFYAIAQTGKAQFRFTCNQNIIVSDIKPEDKAEVESILQQHGIIEVTQNASRVRRNAIACVALNTCPLALAEAQRYLPSLIGKIEGLLDKHNLANEELHVRMTGCPNGCGRPYAAEIGFVGTASGRYNIYLGADALGKRLNKLYKENIDEPEILNTLDVLLKDFSNNKNHNEPFGDYVMRKQLV